MKSWVETFRSSIQPASGHLGMWATLLGSFREEQEEHRQTWMYRDNSTNQQITRRQAEATLSHTDAWADSRCHQLFTIQWPGGFALTQETLVCQNMSRDVTCRSGQWCLLTVIFCPAPKSKFFGQHFGMEGPMQLFTAFCIAIPSAWDRRAWRCMSIRAADRGEALVLRQICKIGGSVDVDCLADSQYADFTSLSLGRERI